MNANNASIREFSLISFGAGGPDDKVILMDEVLSFVVEGNTAKVSRNYVEDGESEVYTEKTVTLSLERARRIYRYFARHGFVPVI